jgi:23S rRNA pseudouridine2604 synthase
MKQQRSQKAATKSEYPMRINKYLAHQGYATRRGADELITRNKVLINGAVAKLGDKVLESDEVVVRDSGGKKQALKYFAYNKPRDVITHSPQEGEEDIKGATSQFPELAGTFPVGRLDKDSYGLIILTNDGRITDRLLNPEYAHEKEYRVETRERLREGFAKRMEMGVDIEGYQTKPAVVKVLGENIFAITLTEGKKHQIRRMVSAMRNEVADLRRTRIMNITLGKLKPGDFRPIDGEELTAFLKSLGL